MSIPRNIIIIAGGKSVASYNIAGLSKKGMVIGVNDSFLNFDECFVGITMDRVWIEARIDKVLEKKKPFFARYACTKYIESKIRYNSNIRLFHCDETNQVSFDPEKLNGTSSGMCAVNLALQLKPDFIYLLGFDMHGARWYDYDFKNWEPKGNKFLKWIRQFEEISQHYKNIINVNHMSALRCFPTMTYEEFSASA